MLHLLQAMTVRQPAESAFLVCGNGESIIQISRLERPEVMCFFSSKFFCSFFFLPFPLQAIGRFLQINSFAGTQYVQQIAVELLRLSGVWGHAFLSLSFPLHLMVPHPQSRFLHKTVICNTALPILLMI